MWNIRGNILSRFIIRMYGIHNYCCAGLFVPVVGDDYTTKVNLHTQTLFMMMQEKVCSTSLIKHTRFDNIT